MKTSQLFCVNHGLIPTGALFFLFAMAFSPLLQAQTNTPVTGRMAQPTPVAPFIPTTPVAAGTAAPFRLAPAMPTGQSQAAPSPNAAAAPVSAQSESTLESAPYRTRVGDVTRSLLQAQVDGRVAGTLLPMLGATSDASWDRYLNSFAHPMPEFFEAKVSKNNAN
ncbi:DUF3613 domain-containing protein [Glaciimonas sp. PAMC28666]|uniref:DUF3613 domain-containing protein n=1 Tax=Glaciimonas sp. PAMC28666 TaxID=2807626 RepID=UPI001F03AF24|nr:DUF3613 domain-containing protein [Glaciimonas sp. PAMC28666]